jgi:hypothetical protein
MWNAWSSQDPTAPAPHTQPLSGGWESGPIHPLNLEVPMLLERLTAWTLVVVYYTITCGAILLGLRGAL